MAETGSVSVTGGCKAASRHDLVPVPSLDEKEKGGNGEEGCGPFWTGASAQGGFKKKMYIEDVSSVNYC